MKRFSSAFSFFIFQEFHRHTGFYKDTITNGVRNNMWRIEFFNGLRAQNGENTILRFRTQKTAALLAYLAFFPVPHTRDFLIELLWPNTPLETGRNNLRLALASLRRQFELPGAPQGSFIVAGRVWVQLNPLAFVTDVQQFEMLLNSAVTTPENAADLWKQALECYRGPLLRGYSEDWIPVEEQRLENLMLSATRRLIKFCEAQNDLEAAQYYAHKAARLSQDTAMRADATRLLHGKSENTKSVKNKPLAQKQMIESTGRKLVRIPPLPARLTRFFGRTSELRQIQNFLDDSQTRLLTLTGSGGTGKTRLTLEGAWHFHEAQPDASLCFVALADVNEADFIADAIAQALLLPPPIEPIRPTIERVLEALQQKQTRLLVLDNFEQLVNGGEAIVQRILEAVPTLHCVVTSRQVLKLAGEQELSLRPLDVPPVTIDAPARLQEFSAVRLFVDRARARRADFQITPHNAASLGELLRRLDGLPLAIEICAARSNILSPHQMLLQLQGGNEFAGEARLGLAARQNSLRAAFEWSYGLLTSDLQCALRHLSLFRGGFSLEAAQAVCGNIPVLSSLSFLRDASLVQSAEIITPAGHSEMRYSLLDTISKFASEKLGAEESFAAHERHATFYVSLAESAHQHAVTLPSVWRDVVEGEPENLSLALQWSVDSRLDLALRLIVALKGYWAIYDTLHGRAMMENAVAHLRGKPESSFAFQARILCECGDLALRQADFTKGKLWLEESLQLSRQINDANTEAAALTSLGLIAVQQGEGAEAKKYLGAAAAIYSAKNDFRGLAWTLRHVGNLARRGGNLKEARNCFDKSLALFESIYNESGKAWLLLALGELDLEEGLLPRAEEFCLQAEHYFRQLGHKTGLLWALRSLGEVAGKLGDKTRARLIFEECLTLARQLQNQMAIDIATQSLEQLTL